MQRNIAEVKQDVKEIKDTVSHIEENEPAEVMSMLKLINKNIELDRSYNDKKFSSLERRIHELEERLNN
ncbi:hypothetical protein A2I97_19175 [Bacillus velezensis]|nr:hypothetical protein A2I97_19175 [Bacillus velezensis]